MESSHCWEIIIITPPPPWHPLAMRRHITHLPSHYKLHYITWLHYIITVHYITLHYITLHFITLHYITRALETMGVNPNQTGGGGGGAHGCFFVSVRRQPRKSRKSWKSWWAGRGVGPRHFFLSSKCLGRGRGILVHHPRTSPTSMTSKQASPQ